MKKILLFFLPVVLFACDKEADEFRIGSLEAPIVTGYQITSPNGMPLQDIGTPNNKTRSGDGLNSIQIKAYPIPVSHRFAVMVDNRLKPENQINVWLVAAKQSNVLDGFSFMQTHVPVSGGQPLVTAVYNAITGQNNFMMDVSGLPEGAYRLYVQVGDVLLWENILKRND